jgi:hypothetical protein
MALIDTHSKNSAHRKIAVGGCRKCFKALAAQDFGQERSPADGKGGDGGDVTAVPTVLSVPQQYRCIAEVRTCREGGAVNEGVVKGVENVERYPHRLRLAFGV